MIIERVVTGPLEENCYFAICPESREAALIDPGDDAELILHFMASKELTIRHILLTHAHFDHLAAVAAVQQATGAPVSLHRADKQTLATAALQTAMFGFPPPDHFEVANWLEGGEEIVVGALRLQVLFTPGHSAGGVCYYGHGHLFSGDILFRNSIGRSDLPGGNSRELLHSIRTVLYVLPDETLVHPGHGDSTSIGYEKRYNPFLR